MCELRKIRVLQVIDGLGAGGKERQLIELLRLIDPDKFIVGVVTFSILHQHYVTEALRLAAFFRELNLKRKIRLFKEMKHSIAEFDPDLIHTWDTFSSFYALRPARSAGIPLIDGSIRDAGVERRWEYLYKRYFLKHADVIVSNSRAGLKYYHVSGEVIYNAIDRSRFRAVEQSDQFNIIMSASFTAYKDHDTFFRAARCLLEDGVVDNVYLAGDGPKLDKYRRLVKRSFGALKQRVQFLGRVSDIEKWLSRCRIGVLCSTKRYSEGISNSILEYMAAGLVPIATEVGAVPEIIDDRINGLLVQARDWHGIVAAVRQLRQDDAYLKRLIENAGLTIMNQFDARNNISRFMSLYQNALAK